MASLISETNINTKNFLLENEHYKYNPEELAEKIGQEILHSPISISQEFETTLNLNINNQFYVKLVLSSDGEIIFIVAHAINELEKIPIEESDLPSMKALTVFLSKAYDYFQSLYGINGIYEFSNYLLFYSSFHTTTCTYCHKIFIKDSFGVAVPPILRDPIDGRALHVQCCNEFEEHLALHEMGSLGFATQPN